MHRSSHSHAYATSAYDEDMCLKPPLLLWLAVLFLSRAIMLPIMIGVGHFSGVDADAIRMLRGYWSTDQLIPAAFSFPILYACCRRVPAASVTVRWIWSRGRILLALAAVLDIAVPVVPLLWHRDGGEQMFGALFIAAMDAYFLAYVLAARRLRDTFLDFPPPS